MSDHSNTGVYVDLSSLLFSSTPGWTAQAPERSIRLLDHSVTTFPDEGTFASPIIRASTTNSNIYSELSVFSAPKSTSISITASTALGEMLYVFTVSSGSGTDTTEIALTAREAMIRVLQVTSRLYQDVIEKCNAILGIADIDEPEQKGEALTRLRDVLEPFNSVMYSVFQGLLRDHKSQPIAVSFLLGDVLPALDGVEAGTRLAIINSALIGARPSTRFAAVQALDNMGIGQAKQLMASVYPNEPNTMVRNFINASLRAG